MAHVTPLFNKRGLAPIDNATMRQCDKTPTLSPSVWCAYSHLRSDPTFFPASLPLPTAAPQTFTPVSSRLSAGSEQAMTSDNSFRLPTFLCLECPPLPTSLANTCSSFRWSFPLWSFLRLPGLDSPRTWLIVWHQLWFTLTFVFTCLPLHLVYFYLFVYFVFCLFRATPARHMEVPRLGVESELQLLAYTTAQQCQIRAVSAIYTTAHGSAGSLTHWVRGQGWNPQRHGPQLDLFPLCHDRNSYLVYFKDPHFRVLFWLLEALKEPYFILFFFF